MIAIEDSSHLILAIAKYPERIIRSIIPASEEKKYDDYLIKSRINVSSISYISFAVTVSILFFVVFALASAVSYMVERRYFLIISAFAFLAFSVALYVSFSYPEIRIGEIKRDVEKNFSAFVTSMYALSASGMPVNAILEEISKNDAFGEIAQELRRVMVRTDIFGVDLIRALEVSEKETPSKLIASIFTGIRISLVSNIDIASFLKEKADYYQKVSDSRMKISLDTLGIATESFVAVVIAFPILLYITVSIVSLKNRNAEFFIISMAMTVIFFMVFYFVFRKMAGGVQ